MDPLIGGRTVDYRIDADERTRFKRCRRQWDFCSPHRRNLVATDVPELAAASAPAGPTVHPALPAAVKDALAVYYYPGTWDWPHQLTQSLVQKAFERSLAEAGGTAALAAGLALLDCYDAWAGTVDDFSPIKIDHDLQGLVPDPRAPELGLMTPDGLPVIYTCRVDLLAVDAADEYWVVRHQAVDEWQHIETLIRDEEAVATCWAWEQEYIGMEIAGTIHNEVRIAGPLKLPAAGAQARRVDQNEPSGGGRSIPQHRRMYARASAADDGRRTVQRTAGVLRRTRIRRSREQIAAVGSLIGAEAVDMTTGPAVYPTPAAHCQSCDFSAPCLALTAGMDPEELLARNFGHPRAAQPKVRLGQSTWSFGRGAAPPQW